jgi:pyruvate formate-lyase/glycerol dehydratase family glycyl radical enzyme
MNNAVLKNKQGFLERKSKESSTSTKVTCYFFNKYMENIDQVPIIREAKALKHFWGNVDLQFFPDEIIVGRLICREPVAFYYAWGTGVNMEHADEWIKQENLGGEQQAEFMSNIERINQKRYIPYNRDIFTSEEQGSIDAVAATSTFFGGHMVMNHEYILSKGLDGIGEDLEKHRLSAPLKQNDFYDAMYITLEGIKGLILRYSEKAYSLANENIGDVSNKLNRLSKDLAHIAGKPPTSFVQALQLVWFIHLVSDYDSFGRFDRYLYPFFKNDLAAGKLDMDTALEVLEGFWVKIEEAGYIQNMTIGGMDSFGEPCYNELTYLCLKATLEMGFSSPNLCLRVNDKMPEKLWRELMVCLGSGQGLPALYNDNVIIEYLTRTGIPVADSRNYCLAGCSQVIIPGVSNFVNDIGVINVAKCLELTYLNGYDPFTGKNVGLKTGEVEGFSSFNQFMEAFKKQLEYFCKLEAQINNKDILYRSRHEGYAVRTLFTSDCLEKGIGVYDGGARYNNVQLECIGLTNVADSLVAIKKAVFDENMVTFRELVEVLKDNFKGYESLRRYLLNNVPKFGNDIDEVDNIRRSITDYVYKEMRKQKGISGGIYIPGEVIFTAHEWNGYATGATPDGRYSREVLADSAGAGQGMDKKGPTALLNSVLCIPNDGILTSIVLNIKFMKQLWEDKASASNMISLFKSFFLRGGMQLQVNVCDNETLIAALENSEKYSSLIVRVGGYSAYFTSLSRTLQEEIIKRALH